MSYAASIYSHGYNQPAASKVLHGMFSRARMVARSNRDLRVSST